MSGNELLWNWKTSLGILLTLLLFVSQQDRTSATSLKNEEIGDWANVQSSTPQAIAKIEGRFKTQLLPTKYLAQNQPPNPIPPRTPEPPLENVEPQSPPPVKVPATPSQITPELLNIPGKVVVKEFQFEGNEAFSDDELNEAVQQLKGKPISFAELLQVEEIIKDKYTAGCQGENSQPCYINSGAFIPADQTFTQDNAKIVVRVVEGGIENVEITGLNKLKTSYVRRRSERGIGQPLEREELLEQLQILQLDPLIQNISAELAAGTRPEKSVLELTVQEADPFFVELFTDNARAPSVGSWRRGIRFNEGNLFGFGDRLGGEYVNTDGSNAVDLSYSVPITASNTTVDIRGGVTSTEVVEEPFDRADIIGDSFNFEFGVRQPVYRTPTTEIAVGLSGTRQESNTEVDGQNFQLSPGADLNGETRISALRFSQDYTKRTLQDVFALRSQFNVGLDVFDSSINEDPIPDSRFFAWRGQGQYVRRLGQTSLFLVRSDLGC